MKKVNEKLNVLIILCSVLIVIFLIVLLILWSNYSKKEEITKESVVNNYKMANDIVELPETVSYTNDKLEEKHCLNSICISNTSFHYRNNEGTVNYNITNVGDSIKSGLLKMNFSGTSLIVVFQDLGPGESVSSSSQYVGMEILNKEDFKLEVLKKSDNNIIIK